MNEILQKRIEEAAIKASDVCEPCDYGDPFCASCHRPYMYDAAKKMGEIILNNQWISVEEELPEKNTMCFVRKETEVGVIYDTDYIDYEGKWFFNSNRTSIKSMVITHWMPIPSLEGGEE